MQHDIDAALDGTGRVVEILGCNEAGQESGNDGMTAGRTLPWLQDTPEQDVWGERWHPTYRDVVILDGRNRRLTSFNLTAHDLRQQANYDSLIGLLLDAAR